MQSRHFVQLASAWQKSWSNHGDDDEEQNSTESRAMQGQAGQSSAKQGNAGQRRTKQFDQYQTANNKVGCLVYPFFNAACFRNGH